MEADPRWTRICDLLGREPTRIEEDLAIHLIRTGHLHTVEEVILGRRPRSCPIGALTPVADLILEVWDGMEPTHQEGVRAELQTLLYQIREPVVRRRGSRKEMEMEAALRGIELASRLWSRLDAVERRAIRESLRRFRETAAGRGKPP